MGWGEEAIGEDLRLGSSVGGVDSVPEDADEGPKDDKVASFISMITKPLSLFFSADDEVGEDGKKETFLERSQRLAEEGSLEDQMNLA